MKEVNLAVIGAGFMGSVYAQICAELTGTNLIGIVDVDRKLSEKWAKKLETQAFTDVHDILRIPELDGVIVSTPEDYHTDPVISSANAKKHILVEKPIAATIEDADSMIETAKRNDVKLMVVFNSRFDSKYVVAKDAIEDGKIGEVISVKTKRNVSIDRPYRLEGRTTPLFYLGVHDFDLMRWLLETEVVRVYAEATRKRLNEYQVDDTIIATLKFKNGAIGLFETCWVLPKSMPSGFNSDLEIIGTKGVVRVDSFYQGVTLGNNDGWFYPATSTFNEIHGRIVGNLELQVAHFVDCIKFDRNPLISGEDGKKALEIALAIMRSKETGQIVDMPIG